VTLAVPVSVERLKAIRLLASDVDGVLTDGSVTYTSAGDEIKTFDVKDGHAMALWGHYGNPIALITGRDSVVLARRAQELEIPYVYQGVRNKLAVLEPLCQALKITLDAVCYIGDDWPDMPVLEKVGLSVCPADATQAVKAICSWQTQAVGGKGVMREVIEALLEAHGHAFK
jgi:3-deoxy-D-manno-octulosonate 8-phosphate phosphatase (KDO 8-P phosphatase)